MNPVSKKTFQKFFKNPAGGKYEAYKQASSDITIREHLHFLAQIAHESCYLKYNRESFQYSAERLVKIFPKYFKNMPLSKIQQKYARKKRALDFVYQLRMGNGPEHTGDGGDFRGIFYIQLTGANNWKKYNVPRFTNPKDELKNWEVCLLFWRKNRIDDLCDDEPSDLSYKEVRKITRKINGGYNGFNDRLKKSDLLERYYELRQIHKLN